MRRSRALRELGKDILFIGVGFAIMLFLSTSGVLDTIIGLIGNTAVASFAAGIFFTSVFTIGPASIALANIAKHGAVPEIAIWGALGAMCGDLLIFFFIRDHFADHLMGALRPSRVRRILTSFHLGFMKWLSPILGALIIASPLPDEFGLALLGLSKIRIALLLPVAFLMNIIGIYGLVWAAQLL